MENITNTVINTPLKLLSNRVRRSYTGGMLIEQWMCLPDAADNDKPEEWVASLIESRNSKPVKDEGLSTVQINGNTEKLIDVILSYPEYCLGKAHVDKYGDNMAMLAKILDASVRLSIQVHPNKTYARQFFKSNYGKTEAWYMMNGRLTGTEPPYVLLGFKPGITRELWKKYFEEQDVDAMINALHKFYVQPGEVILIEGGLPHAIGSGCFLIEIQEPTDYTMRVERKAFDGSLLPDVLCHQGVGFENMLDCFNYDTLTAAETREKFFKTPVLLINDNGNTITSLISLKDTTCFTMNKISVITSLVINDVFFKSCMVLTGSGDLVFECGQLTISQGDTYFLPAGLGEVKFVAGSITPLEVILCYPPR